MEYDDFGDKFWPLLGERVYETDSVITKMIFAKAASMATDDHQRKLLAEGAD